MTYYIVVLWLTISSFEVTRPYLGPRVEVFASVDAACNLALNRKTGEARIYRMTLATKDCKAVADPDFINCLINMDEVKVEPGECHPKADFIFTEKP